MLTHIIFNSIEMQKTNSSELPISPILIHQNRGRKKAPHRLLSLDISSKIISKDTYKFQ